MLTSTHTAPLRSSLSQANRCGDQQWGKRVERTIIELVLEGGTNFPEEEVVGYRCSRRLVREDPNTGDSVRARFEG